VQTAEEARAREQLRRESLEASLSSEKKAAEKLAKEMALLREKLGKTQEELTLLIHTQRCSEEALQDKLAHHQAQEHALTAQLHAVDQTNKEFRLKYEEKFRELQASAAKEKASQLQEVARARQEATRARTAERHLEQELRQLKAQQQANSQESATHSQEKESLQHRLQQAEKLYQMMRSHKELTAERNEYLVKISRLLAKAVIERHEAATTDVGSSEEETFGALVNKAIALVRPRETASHLL
jgi:chromosome segregation ATPase